MTKRSGLIASFAVALIASMALLFSPSQAHAYTNSRLMDDAVFDNMGSLSQPQIASFLAGGTGPFVKLAAASACLNTYNDYNFHWDGTQWRYGSDSSWNTAWGPAQIPASTIIYQVSQQWGINPEVILATLQKEESLITGTSCDAWRYTSAMGYGCPDSGGCNPKYAGFTRQVFWGSWQLKFNKERSIGNTAWDGDGGITYVGFMTQGVFARCASCTATYFNGNATIDGQSVLLETGTTASLYTYTPHLGQSFPGVFEGWFGPTLAVSTASITMGTITGPDTTPALGQTITYVVSFSNTLSSPITVDAVGIVGRAGSITAGTNRDFGWQGPVTLQPGVAQQFTFTTVVRDLGVIYLWPAIHYGGGYVQYNNWGTSLNAHLPNLTLVAPLTSTVPSPIAGQSVTLSASIRNDEGQPILLDSTGIPVRFYGAYNYDTGWAGSASTLQPGATQAISGSVVFDKPGPYTAWVSALIAGRYTTLSPILSLTTAKVVPNFSVSGITLTTTTPVVGGAIGASFTVTNNLPVGIDVDGVGVVGRFGAFNGPNRDIGWQGPTHFNASETKSFSGYSRTITEVGTHYYWIGLLYQGNYIQYNNWGSTIVSSAPSFSVSGLTLTPTSPGVGGTIGASFTVTNNLPVGIDVDGVGVVGRFGSFTGPNRDIGWQGPVHFNAGETKSFSGYSRTITEVGTHYYWIGIFYMGGYIQYNNWGSTIVSHS